MTAPVTILASLAQPAARAAMGDAVGAGLSGFDALLAMLTQALDGTEEGQAGEADATTPEGDPAAGDPSLAGWLARVPDSAVLAQTLGSEGEAGAAEETPETCAVSVKSILGDLLDGDAADQAPTADEAAPQTPWHRPTPANIAAQTEALSQADADAALARLREAVPAEAAALVTEQTEAAAPLATAQAAAPEAARQAAAASTDPRPAASRKSDAPASAAAELKTERQEAKVETADAITAATETAAAEPPPPEAPPAEVEVAPATTRHAERPETITQALIGRLDALSANAAAVAAQVRGAPETVAKLAAGILDRLEGQSTRFDLELNPHGLGKVDVSVEIGADGRLTAQLGFDSALGLNELRGRAQELRTALEQAGFSLGDNGLSFDFTGQQRRETPDGQAQASSSSAQAFARALGIEAEADAAPIRYQVRRGLDLLV